MMKIIITGSLGHISKPLTERLAAKGHAVTVISSNAAKRKEIESMGATAAIGSIENVSFLTEMFTGADAVYCMEPPPNFFDHSIDILEQYNVYGRSYAKAIELSGVKQVIHLSSIGAHTNKGNGMLLFHYNVEKILSALPAEVSIKFMRPVAFYYNLFSFIDVIKKTGSIVTNYNANYEEPWVSPFDIADAIATEMEKPFKGREIFYVTSEELKSDEIAATLGIAIGKPDLQWITISDEQMLDIYLGAGMSEQAARGLVEMNAARQTGELFADYNKCKPIVGEIKMRDFAKTFADAYNQNKVPLQHG